MGDKWSESSGNWTPATLEEVRERPWWRDVIVASVTSASMSLLVVLVIAPWLGL